MNNLRFGKDSNPTVKAYKRKVKKQGSSPAVKPSTPGVLVQSNKHNSQTNDNRKTKCQKQREPKSQCVGNENSVLLNRVAGENTLPSDLSPLQSKSGNLDFCSASPASRTFRDSVECLSRSYVTSRDGYETFTTNRLRSLEAEVFAKTLEINELNSKLKRANLKMAEIVAQSAISSRDMQHAAIKEIKNAFLKAHNCSCNGSGTVERFKALGRRGFTSSRKDVPMQSSLSHNKLVSMELELKLTRQELADCRMKLADMKRQLEKASGEKEKLKCYIRSSLKTSFKLYDTLMNQKAVMQLEHLTYQERTLNVSAALIQSAKIDLEENQKILSDSLLTRSGVESTLRDCVDLLSRAKDELSSCKQRALQAEHDRKRQCLSNQEQIVKVRSPTESGDESTLSDCLEDDLLLIKQRAPQAECDGKQQNLSNQEQILNSVSPTRRKDESTLGCYVVLPRHVDFLSFNECCHQAEAHLEEQHEVSQQEQHNVPFPNEPSPISSGDKSTHSECVEILREMDDLSSCTQISQLTEYDRGLQGLFSEEHSLNGHEAPLSDCVQLINDSRPCSQLSHLDEHGKQLELKTTEQQMLQIDREAVEESNAQVCFKWTVLCCVWEGAVISSAPRDMFNVKDVTFQRKPNSPRIAQYTSWEETTPLKTFNLATPRFPFFKNRLTLMETPLGRGFLQRESPLLENLIKSEHEVEILGDQVDELKIVLEKVSSLLDCISNSGISGYKTKGLMRKITEQLQMIGNYDTPVSKIAF